MPPRTDALARAAIFADHARFARSRATSPSPSERGELVPARKPPARRDLPETDATGGHDALGPVDAAAALRVIVADADPLARRLIRDTLVRGGITVVAEATTGREAVELARFYKPEIVVIERRMPAIDGIEATRHLQASDPSISVVVLAAVHDDDVGLRALRAGAKGFLAKDMGIDALPRALFGVCAGEAAISRRFARVVIERYRALRIDGAGLRPTRSCLTAREWEILDFLSTDMTIEQIAQAFVLSSETVRSHVKSVYRKLDVHSRRDAQREAARLRDGAAARERRPMPVPASRR
jgi:DNA-binding NarL/FixJ family response regulator